MTTARYWYVVFEECDTLWWHKYLEPGFRHCWAFRTCASADVPGHTEWMLFDPTLNGLDVRLVDDATVRAWMAVAMTPGTALRMWRVPTLHQTVIRPRFFVSCAGAIAALLGMRTTPITPLQLYRQCQKIPGTRKVGPP